MRKYLLVSDLQKGQALLLVVLVMVISLTVGLSAVTRSVTNARTTTEDENSQRAFSAAEAGIQQALVGDTSTLSFNTNGTNASTSTCTDATCLVAGPKVFVSNSVQADQGADVWLVSHTGTTPNWTSPWSPASNGTLTIYWGISNVACSNAAIEVIILSATDVSNPVSSAVSNHYVADPCSSRSGASGNNFGFINASTTSTSIGGQTFYYSLSIPSVTKGLLMRVIPLYVNSPIAVAASPDLPQQGTEITSTGSAGSGTIQRKLVYRQGYATLPAELFQYIYFVNPN